MQCPECGSQAVWLDGIRKTDDGDVQRYLCKQCGYRFSAPHRRLDTIIERRSTKELCSTNSRAQTRQVCAISREAKNLAKVIDEKADGLTREATRPDEAATKGLLVQFAAYVEREGYAGTTYFRNVEFLAKKANLLNPEDVKTAIAKLQTKKGQPWKNSAKLLMAYSYNAFTIMMGIKWTRPHYKQEETIPFIPEESELDQLIAACTSKRMRAFLQTLKETYADPTEALRLEWIDISGNIITINHPVKGHLPRQLQVSQKLLSMLGNLPKKSERVFSAKYTNVAYQYLKIRKRVARALQNPRLLRITFTTFRHWGGTMIAYYTNGNVLTVKKLLGHKRVESTMKYIGLIHFKDDEFEVTTATTVDEAKTVLAAGFEYIIEKNGIMLFRRPKRFKSIG